MALKLSRLPPAVAYTLSMVIEKGFSIITIPLMAAYVAPSEYGRFDLALSMCEFMAVVLALGLTDSLIRFASTANGPEERAATAAEFLGTSIVLAVIFGTAVQLVAPYLMEAWNVTFSLVVIRVSFLAVTVQCLVEMPLVWLRLNQRPVTYLQFSIGKALLLVASTWTMLLLGFGTEGVLLGSSSVLICLAPIFAYLQAKETGIKVSWRALHRIAVYGVPLVGAGLAMYALGNFNRWFLPGHVSNEEIAFLGLASRLALMTPLFLQPFALWWGPRRIEILSEQNGLSRSAEYWGLGFSILFMSALGVSLIGPLFIEIALPDSYSGANTYIAAMVLVQVLHQLCWLCNVGCYARGTGLRVLIVDLTAALIAVIGYALLVQRFGVSGAIGAMLIAQSVRLALYLWIGNSLAPIPYPALAAGIMLAAAAVIEFLVPPQSAIIGRFFWSLAAVIACAVLLYTLKLVRVPPELTELLPAPMRSVLGLRSRAN